jgi:UDP-3-O-[3-hydroxymyristoyl] N-acetylglucosamine deacetylase
MQQEVAFEGPGLHTGTVGRIVLRRRAGPVAFLAGREVVAREARVVDTLRATAIDLGGKRVATVEHLLAAFGGLGVHEGVSIDVAGPEVPLMDGCALAFCTALRDLGAPHGRGDLEVARPGKVRVGDSTYTFEPGGAVDVSVTLDFDDPRVAAHARWEGDPADFLRRIAPARTFATQRDVEDLARRGLASHVTPESAVVLGEREILCAGRPFEADEPARHKLLDLVGDLFLHGGPPRGVVRAFRPGHGATRAAVEEAFAQGLVRRAG